MDMGEDDKPWKVLSVSIPAHERKICLEKQHSVIWAMEGEWDSGWISSSMARASSKSRLTCFSSSIPASLKTSVVDALTNDNRVHMIKLGDAISPSTGGIYGVVGQDNADGAIWKLAGHGQLEANGQCILLCEIHIWDVVHRQNNDAKRKGALGRRCTTKYKLHMWLVLKNMLWTSDRLAKRGLQHLPFCTYSLMPWRRNGGSLDVAMLPL
jgi:hypothetical protein